MNLFSAKAVRRALGAAVVLTLSAAVPQQTAAQSVFFSGFTTGCFGAGCDPTGGFAASQGLLFFGGNFSSTTVDGFGAVGTSAANNFGLFALLPMAASYAGTSFTLLIHFLTPTPGHQQAFTAALFGSVTAAGGGGVFVNFADNSQQFWSGDAYSVSINDVSVGPAGIVPVSGNLTAATVPGTVVPEPISMTLLGTGLLGIGLTRRRRRQASKAELM